METLDIIRPPIRIDPVRDFIDSILMIYRIGYHAHLTCTCGDWPMSKVLLYSSQTSLIPTHWPPSDSEISWPVQKSD